MASWLDKIGDIAKGAFTEGKKLWNTSLMERTMAACSLVISANGQVKPEEMAKLRGYISNSEELSAFGVDEVMAVFDEYSKKLTFDRDIGKAAVLAKVKGMSREDGNMLIVVCCQIAGADGDFDANEKEAIRSICRAIDLDLTTYNL